jgi:hypothetical protein
MLSHYKELALDQGVIGNNYASLYGVVKAFIRQMGWSQLPQGRFLGILKPWIRDFFKNRHLGEFDLHITSVFPCNQLQSKWSHDICRMQIKIESLLQFWGKKSQFH